MTPLERAATGTCRAAVGGSVENAIVREHVDRILAAVDTDAAASPVYFVSSTDRTIVHSPSTLYSVAWSKEKPERTIDQKIRNKLPLRLSTCCTCMHYAVPEKKVCGALYLAN